MKGETDQSMSVAEHEIQKNDENAIVESITSGGEGKLKTTLRPFAGGLGYDRSGAHKRIRRPSE